MCTIEFHDFMDSTVQFTRFRAPSTTLQKQEMYGKVNRDISSGGTLATILLQLP